jgi:hypothetical protein
MRERQPLLGDIIDGAVRRLSTAIAIAGALIALAIYARPGPPTYQAFSTGHSIVRLNTRTGWIFECIDGRCGTVVRPGQRLDRRPPAKALPAPAAAVPAPTAAPAPAPARSANPAPAKQ